jgi:peptidyl-prolyl cis-trans isomerase SurA
MRSLFTKRWLVSVLITVMSVTAPSVVWAAKANSRPAAPAQVQGQASGQFVDGIAAVVNKEVITLSQLEVQTRVAQAQLKQQKIAEPDMQTLRQQVLQRMITDKLEQQEARSLGIKVDKAQLQHAVGVVAQRNKITPERLRQEVEKSGVTWDAYLQTLSHDVLLDQLRQRAVDSTIVITDADVDAFLKNRGPGGLASATGQPGQGAAAAPAPAEPQSSGPVALGLAQILVAVPEDASSSTVQQLRQKAEAILAKLKGGADFAAVAASSSNGPHALEGGNLGVNPTSGWPDLFVSATQNLQVGQISGIVQSGNGFHILKVVSRGQAGGSAANANASPPPQQAANPGQPAPQQGPMMVTQTHARHILIKVSKVMSDEQAQTRLLQLRQRIESGEKFDVLAKRYSQDATAPQGGDLGWLNPGETAPAFEEAMNALQPGQVSAPVKSQFGWHLIEVQERRTKNMEKEYTRMRARQILFQRRAEPAYEDWLSQLHGKAYIDNRLDPQSNRSAN